MNQIYLQQIEEIENFPNELNEFIRVKLVFTENTLLFIKDAFT
jgi:hypothetical protein